LHRKPFLLLQEVSPCLEPNFPSCRGCRAVMSWGERVRDNEGALETREITVGSSVTPRKNYAREVTTYPITNDFPNGQIPHTLTLPLRFNIPSHSNISLVITSLSSACKISQKALETRRRRKPSYSRFIF